MFNPNSVATTLDKLGVPVPAALETVRAIRLAIGEAATHDYVGDLRAEITAGKVTPKNAQAKVEATATQMTAQETARQVSRDLIPTLDRQEMQAIAEHGNEIIDGMRPLFDEAAATLTAVREQLGPNPNREAVMNAGPAAVANFQEREAAQHTLSLIARARRMMAEAGYGPDGGSPAAEIPWFVAALRDADDLAYANAAWNTTGDRLCNVADAGYPLRLNTADETEALLAGVHRATEAAETVERERLEAEKRARLAEHQRHWATNAAQREAVKS